MKKYLLVILSLSIFFCPKQCLSGHQSTLQIDCISCHLPNLIRQHGEFSSPVCDICHNSQDADVQATVAKGKQGQATDCIDCHGTVDHSLAHDQTFLPPEDCGDCHLANVAVEHENHNLACTACHASPNPQVQSTIALGKAGNPVYCSACHGPIDHSLAHERTGQTALPSPDCTQCHLANVATEHLDRNLSCQTCHASTDPVVLAAILSGSTGLLAKCNDCHGPNDHIPDHEIEGQTALPSPDCASCHLANIATEHIEHDMICLVCHGSTDAAVQTAIADGIAGTLARCDDCHTANHTNDHIIPGQSAFPSTECGQCHVENIAIEHANHNLACNVCHESIDPLIQEAITDGIAGTLAQCTACHGTVDHVTVHDQVFVNSMGCANCHLADEDTLQADVVNEHLNGDITCSSCHLNADLLIQTAIANGKEGIPVYCSDCHGSGTHPQQHGFYLSNWSGYSGVIPGSAPAWTQVTIFTKINPVSEQYQLCIKCHSYNAFGPAPGGVSNIVGLSGDNLTDQAMEFNPANKSAHPIEVGLNAMSGSLSPKSLAAEQLTPEWSSVGSQTVLCSDCHGVEAGAPFMLKDRQGGSRIYWPKNSSGKLWTLDDIKNNRNNWQTRLFCVNCHPLKDPDFYNNVHKKGAHNEKSYTIQGTYYPAAPCTICHLAVPHGGARSRLIVYSTDPAPYNYGGYMGGISGFRKESRYNYDKNNCYTPDQPSCHNYNYDPPYED